MLASGLALGLIAGIALGGDYRRLGLLRLHYWAVLAAALGVRALGLLTPLPPVAYLAAIAAVGLVALLNARLPGALLIAAGSFLNVAVIALNGGMPVDFALARAVDAISYEADRLHVALTDRTVAPFLADVIPMPMFRGVYSVGDFVIAAGAFWLPFIWLRQR